MVKFTFLKVDQSPQSYHKIYQGLYVGVNS